ncbi:MAG: hypothetical protein KDJ73_05330 [Notoacmeibacter sp.]|nr:hypothetical protein [Notoacmeibacter sp.]MCC0033539.1 hypothetical protein [Brucellaceae bacterium]
MGTVKQRNLTGMLTAAFIGLLGSAAADEEWAPAQGWNADDLARWYSLSQGSRLIPVDWLDHLVTPDGEPFSGRRAFAAYGYRYMRDADRWPAGFVTDKDEAGREWLGLTCAACHTSHLVANGTQVVIHGGQSMADFQSFTQDLFKAVNGLTTDGAAAARLAANTGVEEARLKRQMTDWLAYRGRIQATYDGQHWGHGRTDAVGVILATTASVADPGGTASIPPSNAPVSFPYIWNTNQQARLQHNGIVSNGDDYGPFAVTKLGALIRNWTEVFGVFASARLDARTLVLDTSVNIANLLELEQILARLKPPRWPAAFGPLDEAKRKRGAVLYRAHCIACHGLADPDDLSVQWPLKAKPEDPASGPFVLLQPLVDPSVMTAMQQANAPRSAGLIGTDPLMACNAALHVAPAGLLEGTEKRITIQRADPPVTYGKYAISTEMLTTLMLLDMGNRRMELFKAYAEDQSSGAAHWIRSLFSQTPDEGYKPSSYDPALPGSALDQFLGRCADDTMRAAMRDPAQPVPAYKARPLSGIWATAPYLHNGSIPTLHDLLLPQTERPAVFGYLDGTYDTVKAGLKDRSGIAGASILAVRDATGAPVPGNWNGGHEYGTGLNEAERLDLVEYLKGL